MLNRAVFLDRDGVINEVKTSRVKFVNRPDQFYFLEGAREAIKLLSNSGFLIFVVTNQGGVGLGYLSPEDLELIHDYMLKEIQISGGTIHEVSCCIRKPHEGCACRKPEPGMLFDLSKKYDINLSDSYMVGDREVDIEAGRKAGCTTILIAEQTQAAIQADKVFDSLLQAAQHLVSK